MEHTASDDIHLIGNEISGTHAQDRHTLGLSKNTDLTGTRLHLGIHRIDTATEFL